MVTTAWGGAHDADLVGVLIDARKGLDEEAEAILERLAEVRQPKLLILNKVDLVAKETLLALAKTANDKAKFEATFMISALKGDGVGDLKRWLAGRVPAGPWLYPAEQMSDAPLRQLAAEITREKLFERLHQELPYHSTVETEVWKELRKGDIRIEQTIYVERESQRKIVLGKGGQTIKAIGEAARKEIAEIADAKVHLFLFVKVREGWGEDPERYRAMGLAPGRHRHASPLRRGRQSAPGEGYSLEPSPSPQPSPHGRGFAAFVAHVPILGMTNIQPAHAMDR